MTAISDLNIGCKLGHTMSNIIAYADDIVLMAPSAVALQLLIDKYFDEASVLNLNFNANKSKCMILKFRSNFNFNFRSFSLNGCELETVNEYEYLGYFIQDNMTNARHISESLNKFYSEFIVLRKFHFTDTCVKLYLFKQCCLQFYRCEMLFANKRSLDTLLKIKVFRRFSEGFHCVPEREPFCGFH